MYDTPNRSYDAQLGRFHQIDPLADSQSSFTPYHFGYNDPIYWSDPTGLCPSCPRSMSDIYDELMARSFEGSTMYNFDNGNLIRNHAAENDWENWIEDIYNNGGSLEHLQDGSGGAWVDYDDPMFVGGTILSSSFLSGTNISRRSEYIKIARRFQPLLMDSTPRQITGTPDLMLWFTPGGGGVKLLSKGKGIIRGIGRWFGRGKGAGNAYKIARSGGKHSGFLKNYIGRSPSEINKAINSIQNGKRGINVHLDKIANPSKFVPNWNNLRLEHQQSLIRGWQAEITNGRQQIDILRGILGN